MPGRKSFLLRIDPALWTELESWAQHELRSVNGQVEFLLREAVARRRRSGANPGTGFATAHGVASPSPPDPTPD
jgi:hypothetical protein